MSGRADVAITEAGKAGWLVTEGDLGFVQRRAVPVWIAQFDRWDQKSRVVVKMICEDLKNTEVRQNSTHVSKRVFRGEVPKRWLPTALRCFCCRLATRKNQPWALYS